MIIKDKQITQKDILEICKKRENEENVKLYSFEEAYKIGLEYTPKI